MGGKDAIEGESGIIGSRAEKTEENNHVGHTTTFGLWRVPLENYYKNASTTSSPRAASCLDALPLAWHCSRGCLTQDLL